MFPLNIAEILKQQTSDWDLIAEAENDPTEAIKIITFINNLKTSVIFMERFNDVIFRSRETQDL